MWLVFCWLSTAQALAASPPLAASAPKRSFVPSMARTSVPPAFIDGVVPLLQKRPPQILQQQPQTLTPPSAKLPVLPHESSSYTIATIRSFDRQWVGRCGEPAKSVTRCWTDGEGNTFRYGCLEDDLKVYGQSCGLNNTQCDPAKCSGEWTWGGDRIGVCYDNGEELYAYDCGPQKVRSAKSCSQLGWPPGPGVAKVCANSKVSNGECSIPKAWQAARDSCASIGARLCTAKEVQNEETRNSGCKNTDCDLMWTNDVCTLPSGQGGHMSMIAGSSRCPSVKFARACQTNITRLVVRCCADAEEIIENPTLPKGFFGAVAYDYRTGGCEGPALAAYSCWSDEEGNNQRMACREDDNSVYFQSCKDSSCRTCSGNWTTEERLGVCYSAPNGYLYKYSCPGNR